MIWLQKEKFDLAYVKLKQGQSKLNGKKGHIPYLVCGSVVHLADMKSHNFSKEGSFD